MINLLLFAQATKAKNMFGIKLSRSNHAHQLDFKPQNCRSFRCESKASHITNVNFSGHECWWEPNPINFIDRCSQSRNYVPFFKLCPSAQAYSMSMQSFVLFDLVFFIFLFCCFYCYCLKCFKSETTTKRALPTNYHNDHCWNLWLIHW